MICSAENIKSNKIIYLAFTGLLKMKQDQSVPVGLTIF